MGTLAREVAAIVGSAKEAAGKLALADTKTKDAALKAMARGLRRRAAYLLKENAKDVRRAKAAGSPAAMVDRLLLTPQRVAAMAGSIDEIARLEDPVGEVIGAVKRPNGLVIKKVRVPIGVILIIYESRPNVTTDCAALCLKSGNSVILRGGSESLRSNIALYRVMRQAAAAIHTGAVQLVTTPRREMVRRLLARAGEIDLVIPRGGESLIREVARLSKIPVVKHYKGVCHTYVDRRCDIAMAEKICVNAKVQRPGVCNAMETLLVHKEIAPVFIPRIVKRLKALGVEIRGCPRTRRLANDKEVRKAAEADWYAEYLDLILAVKVVASLAEAVGHIARYGSRHSDAIVTRDRRAAKDFLRAVDSACVYVNASTRFTDGNQFGKGAEIGISTEKLHARGPMGLEELTSYKYVVYGDGQVRE